jgi:ATP-dependent Clp protease ATP-binding subunit ClpC
MDYCDICRVRPAVYKIRLTSNGQSTIMNVCDVDYAQIQRTQFGNGGAYFDDPTATQNFRSQKESLDIEELLSENSKKILQEAGAFAVSNKRSSIDTEDLLYALCDDKVTEKIMKKLSIKPADIKGYIEANTSKGSVSSNGEINITPRVKKVFELALEASRDMNHSYIGPEHLLIGLSEEPDGMAGDILKKYGLKPTSVRQQTLSVVGKGAKEGNIAEESETPNLDKYSRDLTQLARNGKIDPVIGRQKEIDSTIEILARRTKNNPALIGEPGVGKTSIVEGLAQKIVNNKVPEVLKDKRVIELSLVSLMAGAKYKGEFEERLKNVLDEITKNKDNLIVFIDELHTVVATGGGEDSGGLNVSNAMKPALARGELNLIGATTLNEYQKYIEKDSALERRFQPVFVPEPTESQAIEILRGLRDKYEAHHGINISDEAIVSSVELSSRYLTNRFLPDKAIDLLDQAAARVRVRRDSQSLEMAEINDDIAKTQRERDQAQNRKEYDVAKELTNKIDKLTESKENLEDKMRKERNTAELIVDSKDIASVVSTMTGIPVKSLTDEEKKQLLEMEKQLQSRVIGQDDAVVAVSNAVRLSRAGLNKKKRPIASFMFLGPTGVGKTELAKTLAWAVFDDEDNIVRIDMSEYMEKHSVARLIGAPPGYVGYDEGGQLTEKVKRRPYSVILLDEIEKAHGDIQNILLQILDDGRLTDGKGRVVDFSNTIIIATSNLGSKEIQKALANNPKANGNSLKEIVEPAIRSHFKPEFINRWDEIVVFRPLNESEIEKIVELQLASLRQMALGQNIELIFSKNLIKEFAKRGYKPEYGARELRREIRSILENELAKQILSGDIISGDIVEVNYNNDSLNFNKKKVSKK